MINLRCEGHDAEYEISNIINLFTPYIQDELQLETHYQKSKVYAKLKDGNLLLNEAIYPVKEIGDPLADKKALKQALKKAVYMTLTDYTNRKMPWGILTGIRPTKLVHELLEEGLNDEVIDAHLKAEYLVSANKRILMREVAKEELAILRQNKPEEISLYIGIPFCPTRCVYCSFTAYSLEKCEAQVEPYLEALFKEITFVAEAKKGVPIRSLYIGGGTPTSLNEDQLLRLLEHVNSSFDLSEVEEYTIEAGRPDTITKDKLRIMKEQGVGRISINPQSMNQKTLDTIGRRHGVEDIKRVFAEARALGHDCINMDMILGLPGETVADVAYTLDELEKLGPENITVHTMAIKRASRLKEELMAGEEAYALTEGEKIQQMLELCEERMARMGLKPYYMYRQKNMLGNFENVGYAAPGTQCVYNIEIMEEKESIIALGAGAITKMVYQNGERIDRIPNVKSLKDYIERIDEMIERKREGFLKYR